MVRYDSMASQLLTQIHALGLTALAALLVFGIVQAADWDIRNDRESRQGGLPAAIRAAAKILCYVFGTVWLTVTFFKWWDVLS